MTGGALRKIAGVFIGPANKLKPEFTVNVAEVIWTTGALSWINPDVRLIMPGFMSTILPPQINLILRFAVVF